MQLDHSVFNQRSRTMKNFDLYLIYTQYIHTYILHIWIYKGCIWNTYGCTCIPKHEPPSTHVHPWWIHVNVWQNQYSIVKKKEKCIWNLYLKTSYDVYIHTPAEAGVLYDNLSSHFFWESRKLKKDSGESGEVVTQSGTSES